MQRKKIVSAKLGLSNQLKHMAQAFQNISSIQMHRLMDQVVDSRTFFQTSFDVYSSLRAYAPDFGKQHSKDVLYVLTADSIFVGDFNDQLIHAAIGYIGSHDRSIPLEVIVGDQTSRDIIADQTGIKPLVLDANIDSLTKEMSAAVVDQLKDPGAHIQVLYHRFEHVMKSQPVLISLDYQAIHKESVEYEFEPSKNDVMEYLIRQMRKSLFVSILAESAPFIHQVANSFVDSMAFRQLSLQAYAELRQYDFREWSFKENRQSLYVLTTGKPTNLDDNSTLLDTVKDFAAKHAKSDLDITVANSHIAKHIKTITGITPKVISFDDPDIAQNIPKSLASDILDMHTSIHVAHFRFSSTAPAIITSVDRQLMSMLNPRQIDFEFEPTQKKVIQYLMKNMRSALFTSFVLETALSVHSQRMSAMKTAVERCDDDIKQNVGLLNQIRRAELDAESVGLAFYGSLLKERTRVCT